MDKYEQLTVVGEGSYGIVMKCRHKESDQIVAVKKFLETEEDATVRKMALREIRMLKRLKHENLVTMIEVFRYRKRFYLVFEYVEATVLDEIEKYPNGLGEERSRERIYQVLRGVDFLHVNNIIHRDIKPENVLVSSLGIVKLCDFGFARLVSSGGEICTEYVATRWYRAPELLVGEQVYGPAIDIWAIGCLYAEIMTGNALFPGESDIDQLYLIVKLVGRPCQKHQHLISKNANLRGITKSAESAGGLYQAFPNWPEHAIDFLVQCLKMNPQERMTSDELLHHDLFLSDDFPDCFLPVLRQRVQLEISKNPLLWKLKNEILMASDKRDEIKARRANVDPQKWKISFTDGSVKRKMSGDAMSVADSSKSVSFVRQKPGDSFPPSSKESSVNITCKNKRNEALHKKPDYECIYNRPHNSEMLMLRKKLETFTKKAEKKEKTEDDIFHSDLMELTPSQNALHPCISTICFGKDPFKKSPSMHNAVYNVIKPHVQPPVLQYYNMISEEIQKKIEKSQPGGEPVGNPNYNVYSTMGWTNHGPSKAKKETKSRSDQLTLPCVPGATPTEKKPFVKHFPSLTTEAVTPQPSPSSQKPSPSRTIGNYPYS